MPELPEVQTIVNDLQPLVNKPIKDFVCTSPKMLNLPVGSLRQQVLNLPIKAISRLGKHLVFKLPNKFLVIHLKMTGQLIWQRKKTMIVGGHPIINQGQELPNKFTRAIFTFNDNSKLFFNDVRKFGWLKLWSLEELLAYQERLGFEPLSNTFNLIVFTALLQSKAKSKIKAVLLDQTQILGIGNIYADESLFVAKIRPQRLVQTLTKAEIKKLWQAIPKILKRAIKQRGTSFNDYVDAQGQSGNFLKHLQVYGRGNQPCTICHRPVHKIKLVGRGTHYCPHCQR
ncbi:MAG: bifunctional DNA-formamidopyrimidine glycosylase/DNA-(apurinic or apyrimidinic site) lyase [bacterium]